MKTEQKHPGLGEMASTSICGNDILSSVLYVSGFISPHHRNVFYRMCFNSTYDWR
jgi:hypothetical protein